MLTLTETFANAVGQENFHSGTELMFNLLQQPKLNKQVSAVLYCFTWLNVTHLDSTLQLAYMIVDEVIAELFPELTSEADADLNQEIFGQS